jgi:hypothetical protein
VFFVDFAWSNVTKVFYFYNMAEVLDIISRLQFEANTSALDKSIGLIEKEIKAIDDNTASLNRLQALKDRTDKENISALNKISAAIDNRIKKINQESQAVTKAIQNNDGLAKSLARQGVAMAQAGDKLDKFGARAGRANNVLIDTGRLISDLPYALNNFGAVGNNIGPVFERFTELRKETGSVSGAFKALGGSLIGVGGIGLAISIVTALLTVFGDKLFSTKTATAEAEAANKKYRDSLENIEESSRKSAQQEIARINVLTKIAADNTQSLENRNKAINELQESYPAYFGNLNKEILLQGQATLAINEATQALLKRAAAQAAEKKFAESSERVYELTLAQRKALDDVNKAEARRQELSNTAQANPRNERLQNAATRATQAEVKAQEGLNKIIEQNNAARKEQKGFLQDAVNFAKDAGSSFFDADKPGATKTGTTARTLKTANDLQDELAKALEEYRKFSIENVGEFNETLEKDLSNKSRQIGNLLNELRKSFDEGLENEVTGASSNAEASDIGNSLFRYEVGKQQKAIEDEQDKIAKERQQKRVNDTISSYENMSRAIIGILDQISDRQIKLLDLEINIRTQRVTQAVELAKRGNIEVLQAETARLEKAQQERERIARQQIQLNAILQASNNAVALSEAIGAIVGAAAKGDPYTIAARVIAAVAALVGGVLSLKTAFTDTSGGFSEGGYTGQGGKFQVAGVVHKDEFVFSKEKTQKYKPVFEAIHTGRYNPYKGGFTDNKKELLNIRQAIENININAENKLDNNGLHQVVTSTQKINRRKWE